MKTPVDQLLKAARNDDPEIRSQAALEIGSHQPAEALDELVELLCHETIDPVVETMTWAVVAYGEAATPRLLAALDSDIGNPARVRILHALSKVGDPATLPQVQAYADDPDPAVAAKAWWAMARLNADPAALAAHLGGDNAERREALNRAFVQRGPDSVAALVSYLGSDDPVIVDQVAEILVRIIDPMTRGTIARKRVSAEVETAKQALREADSTVVTAALKRLAEDPRAGIAESAEEALAS
ncbi:HEAT repeat domain-containing protein [Parenemella sanctibonifatiensis]|uniref:HEAT repeat domain-containing protein n=1 Tax=Parenemella sanctibonifatiensis TaxID=2016505 RepID=UPI0015C63D65|nr:HEAT repeat domain-containing protein [Parenemella sanctibonifatiensis]